MKVSSLTKMMSSILMLALFCGTALANPVIPIPTQPTQPTFTPSAPNLNATGYILIDGTSGRILTEKNSLLPSFYITRILSKLLSQQAISYPSLGVDGWFSEEQPIVFGKEWAQGFMVTNVWSAVNPLRRGDVLMEINGRIVSADNLWYIISGDQTLNAKILRGGKTLDVVVKVTQTK